MTRVIPIIMLVSFLISCRNDTKELRRYLNDLEIDLNSEGKIIIALIPLIGCSSCIEQTIEELNKTENKSQIKVIFPSFDKGMRYKYKLLLDKEIETFIDYKEIVYQYHLLETADPVLFFLNRDIVSDRLNYNFKLGSTYLREKIDLFFAE